MPVISSPDRLGCHLRSSPEEHGVCRRASSRVAVLVWDCLDCRLPAGSPIRRARGRSSHGGRIMSVLTLTWDWEKKRNDCLD